jgi:hypothetical protein
MCLQAVISKVRYNVHSMEGDNIIPFTYYKMPRLTDLPEKLLIHIIARVDATSAESLPNIGFTCKQLRRISHPMQWEHVVLPWRLIQDAPIARFTKTHSGNEDIRSIRLQPQRATLNAFRVGMKVGYGHMDALCACLASLPNLTTFSISLDSQVDSRCSMPGPVLARLVRALPLTLLHLELDTECLDRVWENTPVTESDSHLCLAISGHIPRLETLYLRVSCICIDLFHNLSPSNSGQTTSNIRRAFIRLDTSPDAEGQIGLSGVVHDCKVPRSKGNRRAPSSASSPLGLEVYDHLLNLQASGAFPQLQRFIMYSWAADDGRTAQHCLVRDIATRSKTRFPKCLVSFPDGWSAPKRLEPIYYKATQMYAIRNHDQRQLYGRRRDLEKALLHEVLWTEIRNGVRLPPVGSLEHEDLRLCEDGLLAGAVIEQKRSEIPHSDLLVPSSAECSLQSPGVTVEHV